MENRRRKTRSEVAIKWRSRDFRELPNQGPSKWVWDDVSKLPDREYPKICTDRKGRNEKNKSPHTPKDDRIVRNIVT